MFSHSSISIPWRWVAQPYEIPSRKTPESWPVWLPVIFDLLLCAASEIFKMNERDIYPYRSSFDCSILASIFPFNPIKLAGFYPFFRVCYPSRLGLRSLPFKFTGVYGRASIHRSVFSPRPTMSRILIITSFNSWCYSSRAFLSPLPLAKL